MTFFSQLDQAWLQTSSAIGFIDSSSSISPLASFLMCLSIKTRQWARRARLCPGTMFSASCAHLTRSTSLSLFPCSSSLARLFSPSCHSRCLPVSHPLRMWAPALLQTFIWEQQYGKVAQNLATASLRRFGKKGCERLLSFHIFHLCHNPRGSGHWKGKGSCGVICLTQAAAGT